MRLLSVNLQQIFTAALKPLILLFSIRRRLARNRVGSPDFSAGQDERGPPSSWCGAIQSSTAWESNTVGSVRRCFWFFLKFHSSSSRDGERPRAKHGNSFAYWEAPPSG